MAPNSSKLAKSIYANTLGGKNANFPIITELCLGNVVYSSREYEAAPVSINSNSCRMRESSLVFYYHVVRRLGILKSVDLPVPYHALQLIQFPRIVKLLNLSQPGRFCLLPSSVVLGSLKNAIEYYLSYGSDLINSYLAIITVTHNSKMKIMQWRHVEKDITPYLTPLIKNLGVTRWKIQRSFRTKEKTLNNIDYFQSLRSNSALWELLRVLYGAIQIVVGTLMARRQSELMDLYPISCLDKEKGHLIFYVRKSGSGDKREKVARPIPSIAVKMILLLEQFQTKLKKLGIIKEYFPIFSYPHPFKNVLVNFNHTVYNGSLDFFCDYMEIPLDNEARRYYIRQHQLRRYFAMLFFWGSSFGGMDSLRWFLAHTDVEHLYHYITESTPGEVLRGVKAHYAVEQLQAYENSATALSDLLEKKYGILKFDLMDSNELSDYVEHLICDGSVSVEPEFINTDDGNRHRILIKVIEK